MFEHLELFFVVESKSVEGRGIGKADPINEKVFCPMFNSFWHNLMLIEISEAFQFIFDL